VSAAVRGAALLRERKKRIAYREIERVQVKIGEGCLRHESDYMEGKINMEYVKSMSLKF
jgi:hypothetical protein